MNGDKTSSRVATFAKIKRRPNDQPKLTLLRGKKDARGGMPFLVLSRYVSERGLRPLAVTSEERIYE
jgi:hypothetical protein